MSAVLLDIEGTVSDKRFVTQTLFPFARERIAGFVASHPREPQVGTAIALMREQLEQRDASIEAIGRELVRGIDEARKAAALQ